MASNVVFTDPLPGGTTYVPGSLTIRVPFTGSPTSAITLINSVAPGQTVTGSFRVTVGSNVNPTPIRNVATVAYADTIDPENPDSETATSVSKVATTAFLKNNYTRRSTI